ncbi:MAG: RNA methyltransferase [Myxococcota bacterium]
MGELSIALVHHPVRDRTGATVTTAITNLDVHDLARSAKTYGVKDFFVVTPITAQRQIVDTILAHWTTGSGTKRQPARGVALSLVRPVESVEAALAEAGPATVVATAANSFGRETVSFAEESARLREATSPTLLLFGTGHGLTPGVLDGVDRLLAPIRPGNYNHLSVRAAVAIALDRLIGDG